MEGFGKVETPSKFDFSTFDFFLPKTQISRKNFHLKILVNVTEKLLVKKFASKKFFSENFSKFSLKVSVLGLCATKRAFAGIK